MDCGPAGWEKGGGLFLCWGGADLSTLSSSLSSNRWPPLPQQQTWLSSQDFLVSGTRITPRYSHSSPPKVLQETSTETLPARSSSNSSSFHHSPPLLIASVTKLKSGKEEETKYLIWRYGGHRWALTITRQEKNLGVSMLWKDASEVGILRPFTLPRMLSQEFTLNPIKGRLHFKHPQPFYERPKNGSLHLSYYSFLCTCITFIRARFVVEIQFHRKGKLRSLWLKWDI